MKLSMFHFHIIQYFIKYFFAGGKIIKYRYNIKMENEFYELEVSWHQANGQ